MTAPELPTPLLATLLFSLIGPIGCIPRFAAETAGFNEADRKRVALYAALYGLAAISIAVLMGASFLARFGASNAALISAAGLILVLVALQNILPRPAAPEAPKPARPPAAVALSPLAIPGIASPVGIAVIVIFATYFPASGHKLTIFSVVAAIMALNYAAMLGAGWFMRVIGMTPLIILGAVFGVLQVALGVQMLLDGAAMAGFLRSPG